MLQMLMGPVALAMTDALGCIGCEHATATSASSADPDCRDCPATSPDAPAGAHQHSSGAGCHCAHAGAHVQAMAPALPLVTLPSPPEALCGEPKGPAFAAPAYQLLRPPN